MGMAKRSPGADPAPALTVVLPVLNEARDIGRLLEALLDQAAPPGGFEVLVADGGSSDRTREIVRTLAAGDPRLRLLENPRRLSSAGRNVGARAARGTYVLFLDGHCALPRSDYLARAVAIFEETGAACLCRPQPLDRWGEGRWGAAIAAARHSRLGHQPGSDIYGGEPGPCDPRSAGAAYRREALEALGGYDERFDACEDVELNCRLAAAGLPAYLHPDLAVEYRPRSSLGALLRQMIRYGRGRARLMARHPREIPWPLALATSYGLVAALLLLAAGPRASALALAIPLGAWLLAILLEGVRLAGVRPAALRIALALAAIPAGLLLGFWRGLGDAPRFRRAASLAAGESDPIDRARESAGGGLP